MIKRAARRADDHDMRRVLPKWCRSVSLVEGTGAVVVIGVMAAFGVPQSLDSIERARVAEAYRYLAGVRAAQWDFMMREGRYAQDVNELQLRTSAPSAFTIGVPTPGRTGDLTDSWSLTLTRTAGLRGGYKVAFNEEGFDDAISDVPPEIEPH